MGRTRGSKHQFEETGGDSKRRGRRPNRTVREGLDAMRSVQRPPGESLRSCLRYMRHQWKLGPCSLGSVYEAALLRR